MSKATPVIIWADPAAIGYGTALGATQLDATATTAGTFVYNPAAGTVLAAGANQAQGVTFTPADTVDFNSAAATVHIRVTKAPLTVTAKPATRIYGQPNPTFTAVVNGLVNGDTAASLGGTVTLSTTATVTSAPGTYPIDVSSTLSSPNYTITTRPGTLTVTKAATVTTVTVSPAHPGFGTPVTLTATVAPAVTPNLGAAPTGVVSFILDGSPTAVYSAALSGASASFTAAGLGSGSHTVTASYRGDTNFAPSASTAATGTFNVTCTGATITGNHPGAVNVTSGSVCIVGAQVGGAVTVSPGASLDIEHSTIGGAVNADHPNAVRICGSSIGGAVTITNSAGLVIVGDPDANCAPNTIAGTLVLRNNTHGVEAINHVANLITANNSGPGPLPGDTTTITGNIITH